MMIEAFIYGVVLAFGLIIPLGVQNIFIFNQGVTQPAFLKALPAAITAFFCDLMLILLAVFGLSLVMANNPRLKLIFFVFGICFLIYMGWLIWRTKPNQHGITKALSWRRQIFVAASVSILNPHAIFDTIGVIGVSALQFSGMEKIAFTSACALVSMIWFVGLAFAGFFISNLNSSAIILPVLNKVSAIILWGMAGYLLIASGIVLPT